MGPVELRTALYNYLSRKHTRDEMRVSLVSPEPGRPVELDVEVRDPYATGSLPQFRRFRVAIEETTE